jgi:dihydrofolate synthase/folylpolyglutamate synthase
MLGAIAKATLRGRLEKVGDNLWIDGAHNPAAARVLAAAAAPLQPEVLVVGMSKDKRADEFLRALAPLGCELWVAQGSGPRCQLAESLARSSQGSFATCRSFTRLSQLREALRAETQKRRVLVTGSLLFLGEVLRVLGVAEEEDPIIVSDPGPVSAGKCREVVP